MTQERTYNTHTSQLLEMFLEKATLPLSTTFQGHVILNARWMSSQTGPEPWPMVPTVSLALLDRYGIFQLCLSAGGVLV